MTDSPPAWVKNLCATLNEEKKYAIWTNDNGISHKLPEDEAALQAISKMTIRFSDKASRLPAELGQLKNLRTLVILCNNAPIEIPVEMAQLQNLQEFSLSVSELSVLPPVIGKLNNLRHLTIRCANCRRH